MSSFTPYLCTECHGRGEIVLTTPAYWGHDPIRSVQFYDCGRCKGSGEEPCGWCGEEPADSDVDGDLLCEGCAAEVRAKLVEPAREPVFLAPRMEGMRSRAARKGYR